MAGSDILGAVHSADFFLMEDLLEPAERDVRDRVRAWCEHSVLPGIAEHWARGRFPAELVPGLAALRVAGGTVAGHGSAGLSTVADGLVSAEIARADGGLRVFLHVHNLAMLTISLLGSPEQQARWLPAMADLSRIGAFAMTEPEHGSDAAALATRARRSGDRWLLSGTKRWIGSGTFADVVVVWARDETSGQVGAWVVEPPAEGWTATEIAGKTACRTAVHAELRLDEVPVPESARLPGADSFRATGRVLARSRPAVAWEAVGHAVAGYEAALEHTLRREQFGRPLAGFQLVQEKLARMALDIGAVQLVCWRLSRLEEAGRATPGMAAGAKRLAAAVARRTLADARALLGGDGVLLERHVTRHQADTEALFTYEGTDDITALIVGREVTGLSAFSR
jgi:glutaryl-CoA dehydrogenase